MSRTLQAPEEPFTRQMFARAVIKALIPFLLFNLFLVTVRPGKQGLLPTIYNHFIPGRIRLIKDYEADPYRLIDDHIINQAQSDTFNIVVLGSSEIWGLLTVPSESVPAMMDRSGMIASDGRPVRVYNLAFPVADAFKDLMILETVLRRDIPVDLVILSLFDHSLGQASRHVISTSNLLLRREVVTHYRLPALYSNYSSIDDEISLPVIYKAEIDALAAWGGMQLRGVIWALTQDDIGEESSHLREEWQPTLSELSPALTLKRGNPRPDMLHAFAQLSQETGIPVLILASPLPNEDSDFAPWLQDQAFAAGLPLLDCWQAIHNPVLFRDAYHMRSEAHLLYTRILINHLSYPQLANESPSLPVHLVADFVPPQETCTFHPSPEG